MKNMKRTLLVLDDEEEIGRLFLRYFRKRFEAVHVCHKSADAEAILSSEPITHVIADHYLGPGEPLGADLIARWRGQFPDIRHAVIFTGSQIPGPNRIRGVDEVYYKPSGFEDLINGVLEAP
jgi:ActR/RegA family two-component response regulator